MRFSYVLLGIGVGFLSCSGGTQSQPPVVTTPSDMSSGSIDQSTLLATIKGGVITENEMEKGLKGASKGSFIKAKSEFFEAQKEALDEYLLDRLMQEEAKQKGKTFEALQDQQITKKVKKVSERDIKKFYNELKGNFDKQKRPMPPLEQKLSDRIKEKLTEDHLNGRKTAYFEELKRKYKVEYVLQPPRMEVGLGENQLKGPAKAPITIVEFSDFQCPFCKRGAESVKTVMEKYQGKVKLYFRDFPLEFHKEAKGAALASRCAGEQGKYWGFHDRLWEKQELKPENLVAHAKALRLDMTKFQSCLDTKKFESSVDADMKEGSNLGVTGTPAFFINGIMLSGAQPFERFKEIIDQELARAKK